VKAEADGFALDDFELVRVLSAGKTARHYGDNKPEEIVGVRCTLHMQTLCFACVLHVQSTPLSVLAFD
jgi:hypothetical protein